MSFEIDSENAQVNRGVYNLSVTHYEDTITQILKANWIKGAKKCLLGILLSQECAMALNLDCIPLKVGFHLILEIDLRI